MNDAAVNTRAQIPVRVPALHSFGYVLRGGTAGAEGSSLFHVLRNCHAFSTVAISFYIEVFKW